MGDSGAMISSNGTDASPSVPCPNCNLSVDLAGFPAGVRFDPTDQELIEHLESMVLVKEGGGSRAHPLIDHFIPTIEGDNDICYTSPENLPGVTKDGISKHFFHRTSKAYPNGPRKRRKIMSPHDQGSSEDVGEAWHKTGKTTPVMIRGRQKGTKKILVLHTVKPGRRERTNWVMHQYHLGTNEDEKVGELVLSKVFYRCPDTTVIEENYEKGETSEAGVGDLVSSDQAQVRSNNHQPLQHVVESVHEEPDTTLSLQTGVVEHVHGNVHHIPLQHHVQPEDQEPDTALSLGLSTGW